MKRAVVLVELPVGSRQFEVEIQEPGIVRSFSMGYRKKPIVSALAIGSNAQEVVEEIPFLMVEVDPDAPKRLRQFAVVGNGEVFEADQFDYRGSVGSKSGGLFHLFENTVPKLLE